MGLFYFQKGMSALLCSFLLVLLQGEVSLSAPKFYSIHSDSACPHKFFTGIDAEFEPGTTASVVWSATNEPPHLLCFVLTALHLKEQINLLPI